ncbi:TonB-dependent receptor [Sphingomonas aliaeris]|uniref:TonB-dependent receptor n=1 Tax=Sphingomonas aliaeris TaxID=2759526 RepID=A0A974NVJ8_9SPHN|nr:TonB-dependent receptor [Sphingomonas aliaeris]QQV77655.1 TonB-dependent receptor [Sphingomonas aliaeris]
MNADSQIAGQLPVDPEPLPDTADSGTENIIVTGSLIRGSREDSAVPVDVIGARELQNQGSPSALDLIKNLSVSSGVVGESNQGDSRANGAEGVANINLRGLGPARTLVLLNGKRLVNAGLNIPAVDVNLLPSGAIGRIEILKDGAAATYGSDAIGGVVNFITREQEGFLASGSYRHIRGSAGDYDGAISFGHSGDGFTFLAAFGYQHRSTLESIDRDYTTRPYADNPQGGYTGGGSPGNFDFNGPTGGSAYRADLGCTSLGGFRSLTGSTTDRCSTQYGLYTNLVNPENRYQAYLDAKFDLTDSLKLNLSALYGWSRALYSTTPSVLPTQAPSANAQGGGSGMYVIPTYSPALRDYCTTYGASAGCNIDASGLPVSPATSLPVLFRPFLVGGNPLFATDNDRGSARAGRESESVRLTAGLTYDLAPHISMDLGGTYSQYDRWVDGNDNFVDLLQNALAGFGGPNCAYATTASRAVLTPAQITALAGKNGCTFFNPFSTGIPGNTITGVSNANYAGIRNPAGYDLTPGAGLINDSATIANFYRPTRAHSRTALYVVDAVISGKSGLQLPGGDTGFAVGGQYRKNTYSIAYSATRSLGVYPCPGRILNPAATCQIQTGGLGFIGSDFDRASQSDVYAGFVELQLPITSFINVQLSARYEDYRGVIGSTLDPQARIKIKINDWLSLRGGAGTTFRSPPSQSLVGTLTTLQGINGTFRAVDVVGNPELKPENATTYNGGVIVDAGGLTASIDYWRYDFKGPLESEPVQGIVNAVFGASGTANCSNPAFANLLARFTFSAAGCGVANVQRLRTFLINSADVRTSGVDFQAQFKTPVGGGNATIGANGSYTFEYKIADQTVEGIVVQPAFDAAGLLNYQTTAYPLPKLKGQAFLQYEGGIHALRLQLNYIGKYTDQRGAAIFGPNTANLAGSSVTGGKNLAAFPTIDVTYRVNLPSGTTVAITGQNVFNRNPPFARLDQNYDPFTASPLGATVKLGVSQKF